MKDLIGKDFYHKNQPEILYTIYKEDIDPENIWINWKENKIGAPYKKSLAAKFLVDGTWIEPVGPFQVFREEDY